MDEAKRSELHKGEEADARDALLAALSDSRSALGLAALVDSCTRAREVFAGAFPDEHVAAVTGHLFGACRQWPGGERCPNPWTTVEVTEDLEGAIAMLSQAIVATVKVLTLAGVPGDWQTPPYLDALAQHALGVAVDDVEVLPLSGRTEDARTITHAYGRSVRGTRRAEELRRDAEHAITGAAVRTPADGGRRGGKRGGPTRATARHSEHREVVRHLLESDPSLATKSARECAPILARRWSRKVGTVPGTSTLERLIREVRKNS